MSQNTKMPFGKYKGKDLLFIAENNPKYLLWLNTVDLREPLKAAVDSFTATQYFNECLEEYLESEAQYWDAVRDCSESDLY